MVNKNETNIIDIVRDCLRLDLGKLEMSTQRRVSNILRLLNWERKSIREGELIVRSWFRSGYQEEKKPVEVVVDSNELF